MFIYPCIFVDFSIRIYQKLAVVPEKGIWGLGATRDLLLTAYLFVLFDFFFCHVHILLLNEKFSYFEVWVLI